MTVETLYDDWRAAERAFNATCRTHDAIPKTSAQEAEEITANANADLAWGVLFATPAESVSDVLRKVEALISDFGAGWSEKRHDAALEAIRRDLAGLARS